MKRKDIKAQNAASSLRRGSFCVFMFIFLSLFLSACHTRNQEETDNLNSVSYYYHYKNLDSTAFYAEKALKAASDYPAGKAEALNNLAFVNIMKMNYPDAYKQLDSVRQITDNQVELLVAEVQLMRLCQRESRNKEFYDHHERALRALNRIDEERNMISERLQRRLSYAESEFHIVTSTYFYYVGLENLSVEALRKIDENEIEEDTAQYLNYLYQIGAGGIITEGTTEEIVRKEWDYLMRCYQRSISSNNIFWQANALQALSEHLFDKDIRQPLLDDAYASMPLINPNEVEDSLLAGYLAERSLQLFQQYGDVYQTAGGYRTLASCYWDIGEYTSALTFLEKSLNENPAIHQAPDLVASIYERFSITYSALDEKAESDHYRNLYLDLQEQTRQDRQLEARAEQLDRVSAQLNWMILAVISMILLVVVSLFLFSYLRRRNEEKSRRLMDNQINHDNELIIKEAKKKIEEIDEDLIISRSHLQDNKKRNVENRAKIFLVNSITPLIDRMIHEIDRLQNAQETEQVKRERWDYIGEITNKINEFNQVLTEWIQLRQGQLQLQIGSFAIQELFDMVKRSRMSFQLKGINFQVIDSDAVVKADKILTLFMINTIADNARKFTPQGGTVTIEAKQEDNYVEISVTDTGKGMDSDELSRIFTHQIQGGHGFGLLNCRGIIERYKKISKIFSVCTLKAESQCDKGSRFYFRLPVGIRRTSTLPARKILILLLAITGMLTANPLSAANNSQETALMKAINYADSAYYSNLDGTFSRTLMLTDSARHYLDLCNKKDTSVILGVANETAVAALALHKWDIYHKNNRIYTQLYKEHSADHSLGDYVRMMQRSSQNKNIAIFLLILLLVAIIVAYFILYYRPQLRRSYIAEQRALSRSQMAVNKQQQLLEQHQDELHRTDYELQQLYISNNVIDNCLSTLKHETMYYPSRIAQLLPDEGTTAENTDISPIAELATYYKELYVLLSQQVANQVLTPCYDETVEQYLFSLLEKASGEKPLAVKSETDGGYTIYEVSMPRVAYRNFFKPSLENIPFLICRQIVRENSELTNRHRCGIVATPEGEGSKFNITLCPTHRANNDSETH